MGTTTNHKGGESEVLIQKRSTGHLHLIAKPPKGPHCSSRMKRRKHTHHKARTEENPITERTAVCHTPEPLCRWNCHSTLTLAALLGHTESKAPHCSDFGLHPLFITRRVCFYVGWEGHPNLHALVSVLHWCYVDKLLGHC